MIYNSVSAFSELGYYAVVRTELTKTRKDLKFINVSFHTVHKKARQTPKNLILALHYFKNTFKQNEVVSMLRCQN